MILGAASAGHGGYLYPPYRGGMWSDMTGAEHGPHNAGAVAFEPTELPEAIQTMVGGLSAGPLWCLCLIPTHERIIVATEEGGDLVAQFPDEASRQSFLAALDRLGWTEPTEPDPRVSETDPWLIL
jgi:hypothetical protein